MSQTIENKAYSQVHFPSKIQNSSGDSWCS